MAPFPDRSISLPEFWSVRESSIFVARGTEDFRSVVSVEMMQLERIVMLRSVGRVRIFQRVLMPEC